MKLSDFFEQRYVPEQMAGKGKNLVWDKRQIIRRFVECFGENVTVEEITPATLDEFERLRIEAGFAKSAPRYRSEMVAIMRHHRPDEFVHRGAQGSVVNYQFGARGPRRRGARAVHPVTPGTLWHLFLTSYRPKKLRGGSPNTDRQYRVQLNHFGQFLGHEPTLADLTEDVVCAFLEHHAKGRAAPTTNKAFWCLYALWTHAAKKRLVDEFPTLAAMPEPQREPRAWTLDELAKLLRACQREGGSIGGVPASAWWTALHYFLWTTGERIGAVLAIRMADVNLDRGEVLVPAEIRKRKTRDMLYRLRPEMVDAIGRMGNPDRELLFPFGTRPTFYNHYTRLLKRAGLPTDRKCKPQRMRRTFASYLEAAGGNATAALAHSSRSIAVKSYLDTRICGGRNPADLLPALPPGETEAAA